MERNDEEYKITWSDNDQSDSENEVQLLQNEQPKIVFSKTRHNECSLISCSFCKKVLKTSQELLNHESECETSKSSKANKVICKNGESKFICQICCRTYKNFKNLCEHEKRHQGEGGFLCRYCDAKFRTMLELDQHKEKNHKVFKCVLCKLILETSETYLEHIINIHNGQDKEYKVCDACGRKFLHTEHLNYHQLTVCGTKSPFICNICGKGFRSKGILKTHTKIHTDDKKFQCSYCSKRFIHKEQLKVHERIHTGEKPYKCELCLKSFAHRESLVTHSTVHTGLKPYLCVCCGGRFSCVSSILAHRRTRPDTCGLPEYCTKLAKACPRTSIKLKTPKVDVTFVARATKVIKESDLKKAAKKQKEKCKTNNDNESVTKYRQQKRSRRFPKTKNIIENSDDDEPLINRIKVAKLRHCTSVDSTNINVKIEDNSNENHAKNAEIKKDYDVKIDVKIEDKAVNQLVNNSSNNLIKGIVEIGNPIKSEEYQDVEIKPDLANIPYINLGVSRNDLPTDANGFLGSPTNDRDSFNDSDVMDDDGDVKDSLNSNFFSVDPDAKAIQQDKIRNDEEEFQILRSDIKDEFDEDNALEKKKNAFTCNYCKDKKTYQLRSTFEKHLRSKHKKSNDEIEDVLGNIEEPSANYNCSICKKSYTYLNSLQVHMKLHGLRGNLTVKCKSCILYFATKDDLKAHYADSHANQITCKFCNKMYACETSLKMHYKYKHSEGEDKYKPKNPKFMCNQCGKILSNKTSLNNHEASNCGKNPQWKCNMCPKALTTKALLKQHMLIHSGELPFKCTFCAKGFRSKAPMIVHERMHTGEKPFKCPYCEKSFAYRENLLIHISTHNGPKRYCCNSCGERFSCISGLKNHWKTRAQTCGADPNRSTKATFYIGFRNGELVDKKKVLEL